MGEKSVEPLNRKLGSLDRVLQSTVVVLPFLLALWRSPAAAQWQGDMAAVRDQGLIAVGLGGGVSTVLSQALRLLPVGPLSFRASLGSILALSLASLLLFRIARDLLSNLQTPPRLGSLLAAVAAATATLCPTWQREATVGGGALPAVVLVLAVTWLAMGLADTERAVLTPGHTRRGLLLAVFCGLALAENVPAGLAALLVAVTTVATAGRRPVRGNTSLFIGLAVVCGAVLTAPHFLRPLAPRNWNDLGRALSTTNLAALDVTATRTLALHAWVSEVGIISLGLAALGLVVGLFREQRRAWMAPIVMLMLMDLIYPLSAAARMSADPLIVLRCLALAAFSLSAALGVAVVVRFLYRLQIPMARSAAVLVVVFHMTVVAVACEEAGFVADRSQHVAAEEWTDLALGALPTDAALLVHSPALTWRLWAAQTLKGRRPDVVVIPVPLLSHGRVMANLLPVEPRVGQLLRDFALTGQASEYGLSALADARPLFVELDQTWNRKLVGHLQVEGSWLRYAPQVLGRSDRKPKLEHVLASANSRITSDMARIEKRDEFSVQVVVKTLKEHAVALSLFGLLEAVNPLLDGIERLKPHDPFLVGARLRVAFAESTKRKREVELRDLLRY